VHELMAGWQWLEEILAALKGFLETPAVKAIYETLAEILHGSWICGGDPHRRSIEDCKSLIEHYAPYSLIAVAVVVVLILAEKLGSRRR
jgi:hypothetical protein